MLWLFVGAAVVVIGVTAAVAAGRLGGMPDAIVDRPVPRLPPGELTAGDVRDASFAVVLRGYSMEQVDALLARLADQLEHRPPDSEGPDETPPVDVPHDPGDESLSA